MAHSLTNRKALRRLYMVTLKRHAQKAFSKHGALRRLRRSFKFVQSLSQVNSHLRRKRRRAPNTNKFVFPIDLGKTLHELERTVRSSSCRVFPKSILKTWSSASFEYGTGNCRQGGTESGDYFYKRSIQSQTYQDPHGIHYLLLGINRKSHGQNYGSLKRFQK